ncbi:Cytochrome c oxidase assembly factor 7 -like protein [Halotydeus destructor]|nr:Cytochrome c oxidase assembly factor 7 -like protein [Halotydeus destructor]
MTEIIKNREELEDFFKNLGIEYRYSCYNEKDPEGCSLLGDYVQIIEKNFKKAAKVYKHGCDKHDYGKTCNKFGTFAFLGRGTTQDYQQAFAYFTKACDNESAEGCFHAGQMLTGTDPKVKDHVTIDGKKALSCFEKSCRLGNNDGCFYAHSVYYHGEHGVKKDWKKAFNLIRAPCEENGHYESCNNLKLMYVRGQGTPKDLEKAKKVQERIDDYLDVAENRRQLEMGQGAD